MLASLLAMLAACATTTTIRDEARAHARDGDVEKALSTLDEGLKRHPDDPTLLAAARTLREGMAARLLAAAGAERAQQRWDQAEALARRVQAIDPGNDRAGALLIEIGRDRLHAGVLDAARAHQRQGDFDKALSLLRQAGPDSPRRPEAQALRRQLELDQRRREQQAVRLAEVRPISLEFRDVNLRMALEALSRETKVNFIIDKDVRPDMRVSVYLRQTRLEDALDLILGTNQLGKKVLDGRTVLVFPNLPDKAKEYQDLTVRSFFLAHADAKQAAAMLRSVLKLREPFVDERLNLVVLRESPAVVELAERLIAMYDQSEAEVMLEVEVLEVRSSRLTELGIRFPDSFSLTPLPPGGGSGLTVDSLRDLNSGRIGVGISGLLVNLRREVGDFNVLANPRIRAKNREKARIMVGDKLPVITSTSTSTGFVSESIQYLDVGIKVEFEPQVSLDDEVTIKVNLEASSLSREIRTSSGSLAYQIGTRNATTTLKLRDGETQVLGGLVSKEDRSNASRVPGLGDIPVAGRLFSSQLDNRDKTEIVLAITPRVLRNVQRPDLASSEFFSGTENAARARPIQLDGSGVVPPVVAADAGASQRGAAEREPQVAPQGLAATVPEGSAVTLSMQAPAAVKLGQPVELRLLVKAAAPVRGLPVEMSYDKARLEFVSAEEGAFLRQGDAAVSVTRSVDPLAGKLGVAALRSTATGTSGDGVLLILKFKALAAGEAKVQVLQANPLGTDRVLPAAALPAPSVVRVE